MASMISDSAQVSNLISQYYAFAYFFRMCMNNLPKLTVILSVMSSNLPLHLPNNPKNAPQHLPKMLSSDKHLRILLRMTHRTTKKPVIVRNRRYRPLCTLSLSMLTLPPSPYQRSKIRYLNLPRYLFLRHSSSPQLRSPQSPSYRLSLRNLSSASLPPQNLPNAHYPLSS
jgi:hypothetical protein